MLGEVSVWLVFRPADHKRAIPLAVVRDGGLAAIVSRAAIEHARQRADQMPAGVLRILEDAELPRLIDVLGALVPGVDRLVQPAPHGVM
jgi:hypothetical protein